MSVEDFSRTRFKPLLRLIMNLQFSLTDCLR